jgi:hypothetical protein
MSESVAWASDAYARVKAGEQPETPEQRVIREAEEQRVSDNIRVRRRLPRVA